MLGPSYREHRIRTLKTKFNTQTSKELIGKISHPKQSTNFTERVKKQPTLLQASVLLPILPALL